MSDFLLEARQLTGQSSVYSDELPLLTDDDGSRSDSHSMVESSFADANMSDEKRHQRSSSLGPVDHISSSSLAVYIPSASHSDEDVATTELMRQNHGEDDGLFEHSIAFALLVCFP